MWAYEHFSMICMFIHLKIYLPNFFWNCETLYLTSKIISTKSPLWLIQSISRYVHGLQGFCPLLVTPTWREMKISGWRDFSFNFPKSTLTNKNVFLVGKKIYFVLFYLSSDLPQLHHLTSWDSHSSWSCIDWQSGNRWLVTGDRWQVTGDLSILSSDSKMHYILAQ